MLDCSGGSLRRERKQPHVHSHDAGRLLTLQPALYRRGPEEVRRSINETFTERFFIDVHADVTQAIRRPPFHELPAVARAFYNHGQLDAAEPAKPEAPRAVLRAQTRE
jgi:hypothetical protein